MTNLADLLPAGGGQNNTDFVADGNISSGAPVILTSDGKATAVAQSSVTEAAGSPVEFGGGVNLADVATAYDTANDKVVIAYGDNDDSGYGKAIVGTVSGSTISFGTQVTFAGSGTVGDLSIVFDPDSSKVIIFFRDNSNSGYGTAIVGTVSGTSISFGSAAVFSSSSNNYNSAVYDTSADKVYNSYTDAGNSNHGTGVVGTVSGTSISFGTPVVFNANTTYPTSSAFDSSANKVVTAYYNAGDGYSKGIVGTVSGTSVSFGSATTFHTGTGGSTFASVYDANANKTLISFKDVNNSNYGSSIVGTVSGTSISFGTAAVFEAAVVDRILGVYDSNTQKVVIPYRDGGNSYYGTVVNATISGTSVTFTTPFQFVAASTNPSACTFDPDNNKVVMAYCNSTTVKSKGLIYTPPSTSTNLTATNLLGLAPEAISDTATGTINTWGSRCESSSLLPDSLSLGTAVEVAVANSQPESITYDTNANKIVLAYQDAGSSYSGYAAVGTVSGTSISFGTPVLINTVAHYYGSSCYDSTNNKVILVYSDGNNSNYLTAIVGTVSGTSISFGTPAVISSQNYADYVGCAYDTNEQKVVVAYKDKGNSNYGTGVVGTVSGTSISFGSSTAFNSSDSTPAMVVYDSNAQKVVIDYWDTGNSYYGTAVVGTVSGTSISFGSPVVYNAAQVTGLGACFDSTNNKVVLTYRDAGNSNYGTALVGTVSGTSISFGSEAVFMTQQAGWNRCAYDTNAQKVIVATQNATDSSGQLYTGTVSGTDISFGTAVTFDSDGTTQNNITYDSSSNQVVLAYQAYSDSYKAKAVVGSFGTTPLTVTSDYYVQEDGTISTTSTSPAQLIGKAITATQINIKDYTG
jgi:hypothetical protein